ncbi:hypothetical protein [Trichothermofontia sp.]
MTTDTDEPTLRDIANKLDRLDADVSSLKGEVTNLKGEVTNLKDNFTHLQENVTQFNDKFSTYQKATQWVVQLAFALIASATVTVVISSVFR